MTAAPVRRPPLSTSVSSPSIFRRPMDPVPAPLVYINGWHGVGKLTVAECLTLLLGRDKSLLIDVRSVGRDGSTTGGNCCLGANRHRRNRHRHEHNLLLTPEHPHYQAFDPGLELDLAPLNLASPLVSPSTTRSASFSSDYTTDSPDTTTTSPTLCPNPFPLPPLPPPEAPREAVGASQVTTPTNQAPPPTPTPEADQTPTLTPTPKPDQTPITTPITSPITVPTPPATQTQSPSTSTSTSTSTLTTAPITAPIPTPATQPPPPTQIQPTSTPCSLENLLRLLNTPPNRTRLAVLPSYAPDTPWGRAALHLFETAAARAGRMFVCVELRCEAGVYRARVLSRSNKGGSQGRGLGDRDRRGSVASLGLGTVPVSALGREVGSGSGSGSGLGDSEGREVEAGGGFASAAGSGSGSGTESCSGSGTGTGSGSGSGSTSGVGCGSGMEPPKGRVRRGLSESFVAWSGPGSGYDGARARGLSLPYPGTVTAPGQEVQRMWRTDGQGLAVPAKAGLTVDVTCLPAFEAALQIVEFVRTLEAERDAELCSPAARAATTPGESLERKEWIGPGE